MKKYTTVIKHERKQGKSLVFYAIMTPFPFYKNMRNFSGWSCSYKNGALLAKFQPSVLNSFVLICGCLLYKMPLFAKFQKILLSGFRTTLNFRKLRWLWTHSTDSFKLCTTLDLIMLSQFDDKNQGSPSSFLSHKCLKLKLRVFLAGLLLLL